MGLGLSGYIQPLSVILFGDGRGWVHPVHVLSGEGWGASCPGPVWEGNGGERVGTLTKWPIHPSPPPAKFSWEGQGAHAQCCLIMLMRDCLVFTHKLTKKKKKDWEAGVFPVPPKSTTVIFHFVTQTVEQSHSNVLELDIRNNKM